MENPIDSSIDLGFVNYVQHPENKNYVVFRFADAERAESFEIELKEHNIWFEKGEEDKRGKMYTLYGLKNKDFKAAEKFNYRVEGKHKKPIIAFAPLRWIILGLSLIAMTLTLVGYCKAQNKLEEATNAAEQSIAK